MPRTKKNPAVDNETNPVAEKPARKPGRARKVVEAVPEQIVKPERKPYPGYDERISMADQQIERLNKLNEQRRGQIARTEAVLAQRQGALLKSETALEAVIAKKARLIENRAKAALSKEEKVAAKKAVKDEEKRQVAQLMEALAASGMSITDILEQLKPQG